MDWGGECYGMIWVKTFFMEILVLFYYEEKGFCMFLIKKMMLILVANYLLLFTGCGVTKPEIEKQKSYQEKQKLYEEKKRLRLEKRKKLKKERELKFQREAIKYLNIEPNNRINLNLLIKDRTYLKSLWDDMYLTEKEKKTKIEKFKKQFLKRKVVFDYSPNYRAYDASSKILYVAFEANENAQDSFFESTRYSKKGSHLIKVLQLYTHSIFVDYQELKEYDFLYTNIPNTSDVVTYEYDRRVLEGGLAYLPLKINCSAKKAKEINENLAIRLVVTIDWDRGVIAILNHYGYDNRIYARTYMAIVYNKKTKKIYKIFY